jgi:CMP-N-acetylneuraminic acid synthetase
MAEDLFGNDIFMKVIAAIPARANSKGLKNKNLFKINGRPLVHYTFRAFQKSKLSLGYVLSDSKKIRNLARRYSLDTNYIRPKKVSTDNTSMIDTIFDFSKWLKKKNIYFDYLMVLQPTSPLRTYTDINNVKKILKNYKPKSLFSISESIEHPFETITKYKNSWKKILKPKKIFVRRQDFGVDSFFQNGAIFATHKSLLEKKILYSNKDHLFYEMKKSKSVEINDIEEAKIVSALLKK